MTLNENFNKSRRNEENKTLCVMVSFTKMNHKNKCLMVVKTSSMPYQITSDNIPAFISLCAR